MKDLLKNKKNLLIGGVVALVVIVLAIVLLTGGSKKNSSNGGGIGIKEDKLVTSLKEFANEFYENHYYDGLENKEVLGNYSDDGINLAVTSLEMVTKLNEDTKKLLSDRKCDYDKSKVYIYPQSPFGKKDYKVKVELSCEK